MKSIDANIMSELVTVLDWVRWSVTQFELAELYYGHGTDNAWDEAVAIIWPTLNLSPDMPDLVYQAKLTTAEKQTLVKNIACRVNQRIPAAYITNQAWFAGMCFYVDQRVLVPRSPIAEVILNGFSPWLDEIEVNRIADVCTGSGCIAVALAEVFAQAKVDAFDISEEALEVAHINVEQHGLEEQVSLIQSDLMSATEEKYDLIVSNPPYVGIETVANLPDEFQVEPKLGLEAGEDGLLLIEPLLKQAKERLNPEGIVLVEVGLSQDDLIASYPQVPFLWLSFEHGGEGVFLLTKDDLDQYF